MNVLPVRQMSVDSEKVRLSDRNSGPLGNSEAAQAAAATAGGMAVVKIKPEPLLRTVSQITSLAAI